MLQEKIKNWENISDLNWYPWVGENYKKNGTLILGESHYEDGDFWQKDNPKTSITIIEKRIDNISGKWTLHNNVEKTLLNNKKVSLEERVRFWNSVVYWNLVQRLLDSRHIEDRPNDDDFDIGWGVFFKIIDILEPIHIIVLGKSSVGRLGYYLNNLQNDWSKTDSDFYNNEKKVITITKEGKQVKLIFINHPSGSFGYDYKK